MWATCPSADWMFWLAERYGLKVRDASSPDSVRANLPWEAVATALANPPPVMKCDNCGEMVDPGELRDGRCEDCDGKYVYCNICDDRSNQDSLCAHMEWSDAAGDEVGTGSGEEPGLPFDRFLGRLGLKRARALKQALSDGSWWKWDCDRDLNETFDQLCDHVRDTDDRHQIEVGVIWLRTLCKDEKSKPYVQKTIEWIDEHLAARAAAIAADKRPRHVIRDGKRRYYVHESGTWTAIREQASHLRRGQSRRLVKLLRAAYPEANVRGVHVLTPHQPKVI